MRNFVEATREAGWGVSDALALLSDARRFGQVAWAHPDDKLAQEEIGLLRSLRGEILASATAGAEAARKRSRNGAIEGVSHRDAWVAKEMGVEEKSLSGSGKLDFVHKRLITREGLAAIAGDSDAPDVVVFLSHSDYFAADGSEGKDWEDVAAASRHFATLGEGDLDPRRVEARLEGKAMGIARRFGLGAIRIGGLPSEDEALSALEKLETGLSELARRTGAEESDLGLFGGQSKRMSIHLAAPIVSGSAYATAFQGDRSGLCLSADNGFATLAHEWFHAFDRAVGSEIAQKGILLGEYLSERAEGVDWDGNAIPETPRDKDSEALAAMRSVMEMLRTGDGIAHLEAMRSEAKERAIDRCAEGIFDRFYAGRLRDPDEKPAARAAFSQVYGKMLDGDAGKEDLAAWRESALGEKAPACAHYDAFVLAEANVRRKSLEDLEGKSLMQAFAEEADRHLLESAPMFGKGYSVSSTEMSARGFEGNLFGDVEESVRPSLVDGRDNALYWPAAGERGKAREPYLDLIAAGMEMLRASRPEPEPAVADAAEPSKPLPLSGGDIKGNLGKFRAAKSGNAESLAAEPTSLVRAAKSKSGAGQG